MKITKVIQAKDGRADVTVTIRVNTTGSQLMAHESKDHASKIMSKVFDGLRNYFHVDEMNWK